MAKHVFKTLYAVAIVAGIGKSSGNEYLAIQVSEEASAKAGLLKFVPQGTNIHTQITDAIEGKDDFAYGSKDKPNVYPLDEPINLGLGCIFEDTTVPKVKRHWEDANGEEQTAILASVRGIALQSLGETVQGLVQREMIRRCNDTKQFSPLRGQDYSSYHFADMTWEEVAEQLFGSSDSDEPVE